MTPSKQPRKKNRNENAGLLGGGGGYLQTCVNYTRYVRLRSYYPKRRTKPKPNRCTALWCAYILRI